MTQFLPPNLLVMFQARPPIPYLPPPDAEKKKPPPYSGVASFLNEFEDPSTVDYSKITVVENKEKKRKRIALEKLAKNEERINKDIAKWDPQADPEVTGDAYKTLFVSRLSYDTSERKLKKEFEEYGPVKRVRLVKDMDGRSRGYAFVEYERERDMRTAYKEGDGRKIDGRRVLVDVERGRTVKGWRPRRFGGGLGGTRIGAPLSNIKYSGREPPSHEAGRRDGGQRGGERDSYRPSDRPRDDRRDRGSRGDDRHRDGDRHRDRDRDRDRGDRHRSGDRDRDRDRERRHH